jgi:hypothetical protein
VHIARQDLSKLQSRKVKALKKGLEGMEIDDNGNNEDADSDDDTEVDESPSRKRRKKE